MFLQRDFINFNLIRSFTICLFFMLMAFNSYAQNNVDRVKIPDIAIDKIEKMIDVGGRELHCFVYGSGSPSVVFISGFNAPQKYWNSVLPDLSKKATLVTYDRPGYGKSEIGKLPLHGEHTAKDLHALLEKLNIPKPYIIVGHSYGGDIARLFVSMYPKDIGGLILEDTQHEDILNEQRKILKGQDLKILEDMVNRMSKPINPKTELDYRTTTKEQLRESESLPIVPYLVITSGERSKSVPPMFSEQGREKLILLGTELQKRLLKLIPDGKQIIAEGVGHNIHIEKPEILIDAITKMIDEVKKKK